MKKILYRLKWILSPYINFRTPVHIDLELSTKCNLNCEFCFRQEIKYKKQDIDEVVLIKVWSEIILWKSPLSVKFNWRGEAVLNKRWFYNLAQSFKRYGIITELNTSLSQNLSNDELNSIAENIDRLSISIDSCVPDIYEEIRKGAYFFTTFNNFLLLQYYRELLKKSKIIINRRTSKLTEIESDEDFKNYFYDNNLKFNIKPAQPRNSKKIYLGRITDPYKNIIYDLIPIKKNKYCGQPSSRLVVDVDGRVWSCCHAYKEQPELYLGNIKEKSLLEIWNSYKRKALIRDLKHGIYTNACLYCPLGGNK
jgi:radical SAM protein with 4Fe4S-binding SPASM domain